MNISRWSVFAIAAALMLPGHASANPVAGKAAFGKSVCTGCHATDIDGFGPDLTSIGKKYAGVAGAKKILTQKVRQGNSGAWGKYTMPPMGKGMIGDKNLSSILDYILSLK